MCVSGECFLLGLIASAVGELWRGLTLIERMEKGRRRGISALLHS